MEWWVDVGGSLVYVLHKRVRIRALGAGLCYVREFCDEAILTIAGLIQLPIVIASVVGVSHQNPSLPWLQVPMAVGSQFLTGVGVQRQ